jgi:hypothetical protein
MMKDFEKVKRAFPWRRVLFVIGLSLGSFLFIRQVWSSYQAIHQQEVVHLQLVYLLGGLILSFLVYLLQMLAWITIMRCLNISLGVHQTIQGYFLSFLPRYIPGSIWGYLSRGQWLEQSYGVEHSISALGSILESLALVSMAFVVAGAYLCLRSAGLMRILLALGCAGLFVATWLCMPKSVMWVGEKRSLSYCGKDFSSRSWAIALMLYLALWLSYGGSILLIGNAVMTSLSNDLLATTFASALSWALGFVAVFIPAGIGIRELTLSTLLSLCIGYSSSQADLMAVISRLEVLLAELGWLSIGLVFRVCKRWKAFS